MTEQQKIKTITTSYNGVVFEGLPKYKANGDIIIYNVAEAAAGETTYGTAEDCTFDDNGITLTNAADTPTFTRTSYQYGYTASCTVNTENSELTGAATQFNITNTLPLTYIKTEKVWDNKTDNSLNKYADSYMAVALERKTQSEENYATVIPKSDLPLTFTLEVCDNGTNYEAVSDSLIVAKVSDRSYNHINGVFTIPETEKSDGKYVIFINYLDEDKKYRLTNISGCSEYECTFKNSILNGYTMTITASGDPAVIIDHSDSTMYKKFDSLPVYDAGNNAYSYRIVEKALKGYTESYSTNTNDNREYTANDNIVTAAETTESAPQMVYIKNTQILGNAQVMKIDQNHYDAFNNHSYGYVDEVLSGAKFALTCNGISVNVEQDTDGKYILGGDSNIVVSDSQGMICFKNFPLNTYTLTETEKLPNYLQRQTPSVFTIDVESASDTTAQASYDSGFVPGGENRIGNLQHVEQTEITLVKVDEEDQTKKLQGATYYLLQMAPYYYGLLGYTSKDDYLAAADKAIKDCNFEITKEDGTLKSSVALYWHTSDMVNGSHIPSVYTTNANGEIEAPQYMLAKPAGDTSLVYAINNGIFNIPKKDVAVTSFTISGMKAYVDNTDTAYEFRLTGVTNEDGTLFSGSYVSSEVSVSSGKAQFTVTYTGAEPLGFSEYGFKFKLQHRPAGSDDSAWETVPDYYEMGAITGLMDGRYVFVEVQAPEGYERSYIGETGIGAFEIKGLDNRQAHFTHKDVRKNANLDVQKVDENGDPLDGAEFELYYVPDKASEPIHLATVETGDDGHAKWITYLKRKDGSEETDDEYLNHTESDIRNEAVKTVKVKKWGTYYWKETKAPVGFNADKEELETFVIDAQKAEMSVYVFTAQDTHKHGSVVLTKTSEQKLGDKDIGTKLAGAEFELYKRYTDHSNTALDEHIYVLKHKTTENLYYVPIAENGKSSIVTDGDNKYLDVTYENMKKALKDYNDSDTGHFKLYDIVVTGENGTLRIDNLDWGQYYLVETKAPTGYTNIDTTTGEANKIRFMVGRNTCETEQQLVCTDEILPAKLKIKKQLDEYLEAWGTPTFIFKIKKIATTESNTSFERIVSMQVDDSTNMKGETGVINIEPGIYEITELNVSRYSPNNLVLVGDESEKAAADTPSADYRTIRITVEAGGKAVVKYDNTLDYYDKFSHTDLKINDFKKAYKSLIVEYNTPVSVTDDTAEINKSALHAWFVKSDGTKSESELTDEQKESLKIEYVKPETDDTQTTTAPQTKSKDELFDDKFEDDTDGKKIVITDPELFADGVYRLKATYGDASTGTISDTFDINMGSRSNGTYQFDTTVVFHASADTLSYYYDEVPKLPAYTANADNEYKFDIPAENAVDDIISVRIPGLPKYDGSGYQYEYSVTDAYAEVTTVPAGDGTVDLLVTRISHSISIL